VRSLHPHLTATTSSRSPQRFIDLAAFDTLDYLVPSIEAQDAWLQETGRENWFRRAGAHRC